MTNSADGVARWASRGGAIARFRNPVAMAAMAGLTLSVSVLQTSIAPALPAIQRDLDVTTADVTLVLTVTPLVGAVSTPLVGRLGDMFGKKRAIAFVVSMTLLGCLVSGISHSLGVLIVGRTLQGLGGSVFAVAFAIIRDVFPAERRTRALGVLAATWGIGGVAGYSLAGVVVDALSYEWIFWFGFVAVAATGITALAFLRESPVRTPARIDWTGALLLTVGLATILIANARGLVWGWSSPRVVGLFITGGVFLVACAVWEVRTPAPFIDPELLRRRAIWSVNASSLLSAFGLFSFVLLVPKLVEAGGGPGGATRAGLYLVPLGAANLIASFFVGSRSQHADRRSTNAMGAALCAVSLVGLAARHGSTSMLLAAAGVGFGFGLVVASTTDATASWAPHRQIGEANALLSLSRQLGGSVGAQVAATLVSITSLGGGVDAGYTRAFTVAAAVCCAAAVIALAAPDTRSAPESPGAWTASP